MRIIAENAAERELLARRLQALRHLFGHAVPIDAPPLAADALGLALDRLELERSVRRS